MNHLILAQADIGQLQASLIKSLVIVGVVFLIVGAFVVAAIVGVLQYRLEKRAGKAQAERDRETKSREIVNQPIQTERVPKRFNAALAESQHEALKERVDGHEAEIDKLWFTLRDEDEKTRKETRDFVEKTSRSLGRIEGKLGTLPTEEL